MESNAIPPPPLPPPPPPPQVSTMNGEQWYPNYAYPTAGGYGIDGAAVAMTTDPYHGAAASTVAPSDMTNEDTEFQRIVLSVAAKLESTRNHQTELEAWTLFASSQLSHHNSADANVAGGLTTVVNTTELPLSITDAWQAIANAATKPVFDGVVTETNIREKASTSASSAVIAGLVDSTAPELRIVTVPAGQQSVAVRKLVMTNSLKRMAVMADEAIQQQIATSSVLPQLTTLVATTTNSSAAADPWLQSLGKRLQELQKYHAEHHHHHHHHETEILHSTMGAVPPESLTVGASTPPNMYSNPTVIGYDMVGTIQEWTCSLDVALSTEEVMGKYLDLHSHYEYFLQHLLNLRPTDHGLTTSSSRHNGTNENNNPNGKRPFVSSSSASYQYTDFLEDLSKGIGRIWSEEQKLLKRKKYAKCITELQRYLESFLQRTVPLIQIGAVMESVTDAFRASWSRTGGATGWHDKMGEAVLATTIGTNVEPHPRKNTETEEAANVLLTIDLSQYESAPDLAAKVDGETLKAELSRLGLKCGGTVQDRATRLYLLKHSKLQDLPPKLFVKKPTANTATDATAQVQPQNVAAGVPEDTVLHAKNERRIDIAYRESIVTALLDQLGPTLEATIRRAERRQTQTLKERQREMDEELYGTGIVAVKEHKEDGADDDSDDEDAPIYNPKNVPLDFDGKPIPYWLFKLHGLNHYYPCEICGGESYRGRRNFELHFGEQKHTAGMRLLGIPNTKHFHGVTKIEDAQVLWYSLQEQLQHNKFDERNDEEYEDSHGNVLSRSVYEDLARQNLL